MPTIQIRVQGDLLSPYLYGWIVQTDVGCFDDRVVSFGCKIKDPTANIFLAATKRIDSITDPTNLELLAIRWSLQVEIDLGLKNFGLQSDALAVVDCINGVVLDANLDPIVADCRNLIYVFNRVSIMFIRKTLDVDAHHLVGLGKSLGSRTWTEHIPSVDHFTCGLRDTSVVVVTLDSEEVSIIVSLYTRTDTQVLYVDPTSSILCHEAKREFDLFKTQKEAFKFVNNGS